MQKRNFQGILSQTKKMMLSEENMGQCFHEIKIGKYFFNVAQKITKHREKLINKNTLKLKVLHLNVENVEGEAK